MRILNQFLRAVRFSRGSRFSPGRGIRPSHGRGIRPSPDDRGRNFRFAGGPVSLALAGALALALSACEPGPDDAPPPDLLSGEIIEVISDRQALLLEHGELPGKMEAGTTEFSVARGDLAIAEAGERIRGRVGENEDGYRLDRIWPDGEVSNNIIEQHERRLREDTQIRGSRAFREIGEPMPSFALFNQEGEVVQWRTLRGNKLALNFIFTRCPVPTMCPAATQRMMQLQEEAAAAGIDNFKLVSVTLDPAYDTPGVLHQYANAFGVDTENFSFLTGPEQAVGDLMDQMGILVENEEELATHSMATVLVDENGRIRHRAFGSNWMVSDFLNQLKELQDE